MSEEAQHENRTVAKTTTKGAHSVTIPSTGHTHEIPEDGIVDCVDCHHLLLNQGWERIYLEPRTAVEEAPVEETSDEKPSGQSFTSPRARR